MGRGSAVEKPSKVELSLTPIGQRCPSRLRPHRTLSRREIQDAISSMLGAEVPVEQELWGILLGHAHSRGVIEIAEVKSVGYHPATAAAIETIGPDWERAFDELQSLNSGLSVVGYYRTARDGRVQLQEDELPLIQSRFLEPHNVFLVIGASGDHGLNPNAGFFFWDRGRVHSSFSFLPFPFDARELRLRAAQQRAETLPLEDPLGTTSAPPSTGVTDEAISYPLDRNNGRQKTAKYVAIMTGLLILVLGVRLWFRRSPSAEQPED